MEKLPQISAAEYEIMKIIWESSPISTNDVCERVPEAHQWSSKTVHTLLSRLTAKQVLAYEQRGRMYYYYPLISQESYLCQENHLFLNRFYNGQASALLSSLLSGSELSDDDLEEMHRLIDSKLGGGEMLLPFPFIFFCVILCSPVFWAWCCFLEPSSAGM